MPDEQSPDPQETGGYLALAQVGLEMVVPLVLGLVIDIYAQTSPWFLITGVVLGFVGGVAHLVILAKQQEAVRRNRDKKWRSPD